MELLLKALKDNEIGNTIAEYVKHAEKLDPKCRKAVIKVAFEVAKKLGAI